MEPIWDSTSPSRVSTSAKEWDSICQSLDRPWYSRRVPKPTTDKIVFARVQSNADALKARAAEEEWVRQRETETGAVAWYVEINPAPTPASEDDSTTTEQAANAPSPLISFTIHQFTNGTLVVTGWKIEGGHDVRLTSSDVRLPLRTYARTALLAVEDAIADPAYKKGGYLTQYEVSGGKVMDYGTRNARSPQTPRIAPTNGRPTPDLSAWVDAYRQAVERGSRSAIVDVANAFHVGRSTASRRIAEARREGLLGPALRNKAGERT
jgi:hypothetical protein